MSQGKGRMVWVRGSRREGRGDRLGAKDGVRTEAGGSWGRQAGYRSAATHLLQLLQTGMGETLQVCVGGESQPLQSGEVRSLQSHLSVHTLKHHTMLVLGDVEVVREKWKGKMMGKNGTRNMVVRMVRMSRKNYGSIG